MENIFSTCGDGEDTLDIEQVSECMCIHKNTFDIMNKNSF